MNEIVLRAMFEALDDLMFGLPCRCGCGQLPSTDHYMPLWALSALQALDNDDDDDAR